VANDVNEPLAQSQAESIGMMLVEKPLITDEQLQRALAEQRAKPGSTIDTVLLRRG
jgi:hypothetical protein